MKRTWIYVVLIGAMLLTGCQSVKATREAFEKDYAGAPSPMEAPAAEYQAVDGFYSNTSYSGGTLPEAKRMVIQNADVSIVVNDPAAAMDAIITMTTGMGGFVVTSNLYKTTTADGIEVPVANLTVRVPAEQLKGALESIKGLTTNPAEDVLSENISGQDVTKDYTDLASRLGNLENAADQLREILASATKTEDVLAVYRELTSVTEQIEVIKGQMQYYEEAAAMSAISIQIQAKEAVKPLTVAGWKPVGTARDALQTLLDFWRGFVNFIIWFVIFILPVLLTIGLPIFGIVMLIRALVRRGKKRKQATEVIPPAETK
ncbi:MAG TPA: DUF4349 domain-containing protein [Anaerolineaceae bacterium]|nr:DUF4349 domain-containing protein [Anaerolineaceae bacterium]HQP60822.1 DUF4349 domain-containing protein [Anaerolineaceae bacterium]